MNRRILSAVAALIIIGIVACISTAVLDYLFRPSTDTIGVRLRNTYEDVLNRHFKSPQKISGTIETISPMKSSLGLALWANGRVPISIDPEQRGPFYDDSIKVGDRVTVTFRTRSSPGYNNGQFYLLKIHVDAPALVPPPF